MFKLNETVLEFLNSIVKTNTLSLQAAGNSNVSFFRTGSCGHTCSNRCDGGCRGTCTYSCQGRSR